MRQALDQATTRPREGGLLEWFEWSAGVRTGATGGVHPMAQARILKGMEYESRNAYSRPLVTTRTLTQNSHADNLEPNVGPLHAIAWRLLPADATLAEALSPSHRKQTEAV